MENQIFIAKSTKKLLIVTVYVRMDIENKLCHWENKRKFLEYEKKKKKRRRELWQKNLDMADRFSVVITHVRREQNRCIESNF